MGFVLLVLFMVCSGAALAADGKTLEIQSIVFDPGSGSITLSLPENTTFNPSYSLTKLVSPDRVILDIPNTRLRSPVRNLPIKQAGIDRIEANELNGSFYQVSRITVFGQNAEALGKVYPEVSGNTLKIWLLGKPRMALLSMPNQLGTTNGFNPEDCPQCTVIDDIQVRNGALILTSKGKKPIIVQAQFKLSQPTRTVIDLANTVIANKSLLSTLPVQSGVIQTIRLGQFDATTLRLVAETSVSKPLVLTYLAPDRSVLSVSDNTTQSYRSLPRENQVVGTLNSLGLDHKDGGGFVFRIGSSEPIVRNVIRRSNTVTVELLNAAASPGNVEFNTSEFPELAKIEVKPLNAQEGNSALVLTLNDTSLQMSQELSLDAKTLFITLNPKITTIPTLMIPDGDSRPRGKFTVVVDPGHGGKDVGANRAGVYEKDLNLSVAMKLKQALEAKGVTVVMRRTTDVYNELAEITAFTNRVKPDAFISVHTNASTNPNLNGVETYYYTSQSIPLAKMVHNRAINAIAAPDRGVRKAMFYVIHHTNVPAVLFEMGYISNTAERSALQSETRQKATAEALSAGVVEFLGTLKP